MKKIITLLFVLTLGLIQVRAQNNEYKNDRNTYLLDVTGSMFGYNGSPNIFSKVVEAIKSDINKISNEVTEIVLVPFNDKVVGEYRYLATEQGKKEMSKKLDELAVLFSPKNKAFKATNTNIGDPLIYVMNNVFTSDKIDYLKLMTDGLENVGGINNRPIDKAFSQWCYIAEKKDAYGFYIALVENAWDENLAKEIAKIENCNFFIILGPEVDKIVQIAHTKTISVNLKDDLNKPLIINLITRDGEEIPEGYKVNVQSSAFNEYIDIDETITVSSNNELVFTPKFLKSLEEMKEKLSTNHPTSFDIKLIGDKNSQYVRILNPLVRLEIINKPEKSLKFYVE